MTFNCKFEPVLFILGVISAAMTLGASLGIVHFREGSSQLGELVTLFIGIIISLTFFYGAFFNRTIK